MKQELDLLKSASAEIKSLRVANNLMSARLQMFDSIMAIFHAQSGNNVSGMSPDLVYAIDKFLEAQQSEKSNSKEDLGKQIFDAGLR